MSGSIAEIRVGDLPKRVRSKLGLKDLADTDVVKVTTVDEVAGETREKMSAITAEDEAKERRITVAAKILRRRGSKNVGPSAEEIVRMERDTRDARARRLTSGKKS